MAFKAVLFDVDGTIVTGKDPECDAVAALAAAHGARIKKQDWAFLAGKQEKEVWRWIKKRYPDFPLTQDEFVKRCHAAYLKEDFNVIARPGIKEAMAYFKARGLRFAAVSNSPHLVIEHGLKTVGCYDDMEFIVSAIEDVPHPKPAPDGFLRALKLLQQKDPSLTAKDVIIFEDSPPGVQAAKASGCFVIQLVDSNIPPHKSADAHVHNERELKNICRKLAPAP